MANFRIIAKAKTAELYLYDQIGQSFWGDGISAKMVIEAIKSAGNVDTINVRINSQGGDVFEGFAIYNAFTRFPGRIEVDIDSEAASIASIIAMSGDVIRIAENAMVMIHDPVSLAMGTSEDLRSHADTMDQVRGNLVATYVKRTQQKEAKVSDWMHAETWFTASEAVQYGFADQVDQPLKMAACANAPWFRNAPARLKLASVTPLADVRRARLANMERLAAARV